MNIKDDVGGSILYYYATGDKVIRINSPTDWTGGIGDVGSAAIADVEVQKGNASIPAYNRMLSKSIARWYHNLRIIAIVGMMSVLVYIGIRILLSSPSPQKAKYKELLGDWIIGMVLLFTMHYIMVFSNIFVERMTNLLSGVNPTLYSAFIQKDEGDKLITELEKYGFTVTENHDEANGSNVVFLGTDEKEPEKKYIEWDTNLMGMLRIETREVEQEDDSKYIGFTIMFTVMVLYTVIFSWTYIKRVIYLAFLTIIAPLVALTYPIDKANDGTAQGFNYWFKEYIFNLLLQPMHLLIYTILISTAVELATTNWIYSLIVLGFIATAEKIVRQMFNFSKASTPGVLAGPAGAALTMAGIRWLMGHGPRGGKGSGGLSAGNKSGVSGDESGITSTGTKIDPNKVFGRNNNLKDDGIAGVIGKKGTDDLNKNAPLGNATDKLNKGTSDYWNASIFDEMPDNLTREEEAEFLRSRGYDDNAIAQMMEDNSWENPTYWNDEKDDYYVNGLDNYDDKAEMYRNLGYDEEAIKEKIGEKPKIGGFKSAVSDTMGAFGAGIRDKMSRSLKNAQPIKALGKMGAGALGAATFSTLGVAAGVASGDAKNVAQYGVAGIAGGYKIGSGAFANASDAAHIEGLDEVYERSRLGEEEYTRRIVEKNQIKKAQDEKVIRRIQEKEKVSRSEAEKRAKEYAKKYMNEKINDVDEWIALEKMQKQKVRNENGKLGTRNYSFEEAVSAYKIHKRAGVDSKEKKKAIEKIQADWNLENDEKSAEAYYRAAKTLDDIMNG